MNNLSNIKFRKWHFDLKAAIDSMPSELSAMTLGTLFGVNFEESWFTLITSIIFRTVWGTEKRLDFTEGQPSLVSSGFHSNTSYVSLAGRRQSTYCPSFPRLRDLRRRSCYVLRSQRSTFTNKNFLFNLQSFTSTHLSNTFGRFELPSLCKK